MKSMTYYCPQTKLWKGNVFTHVCHSVHGGCLFQCMLGYTPWADTPPGQPPPLTDTSLCRHPLPPLSTCFDTHTALPSACWDTHPGQTPPWADPQAEPPPRRRLLLQTVCILLECILVFVGSASDPFGNVQKNFFYFLWFTTNILRYVIFRSKLSQCLVLSSISIFNDFT